MVACIGMMVFTPLKPGALVFPTGVLVYIAGYGIMMAALQHFKHTLPIEWSLPGLIEFPATRSGWSLCLYWLERQ